jgi:mycothione reductase
VTVHEGHARFVGHKQLAVPRTDGSGTDVLEADQIVIATGSRPAVPEPVLGSGVSFHTSDTIVRIDELPDRLASSAAALSRPRKRTYSRHWGRQYP